MPLGTPRHNALSDPLTTGAAGALAQPGYSVVPERHSLGWLTAIVTDWPRLPDAVARGVALLAP